MRDQVQECVRGINEEREKHGQEMRKTLELKWTQWKKKNEMLKDVDSGVLRWFGWLVDWCVASVSSTSTFCAF